MRWRHPAYAFCSGMVFCLFLLSTVGQEGGRRPAANPTTNSSRPTTRPNQTGRPNLPAWPRQQRCVAQSPTRATGRRYDEYINGVKLEMVEIPAGSFCMGSPPSDTKGYPDERPQHRVTMQSFYMGKYEVTQDQWYAVMGANPSRFKGDNLPVENISWKGAVEFCRKLSQMTGKVYRLPSEAEWEYAARAGTTTPFAFGSSLSSSQANFDGNYPYGGAPKGVYREQTTAVGSFSPNNFGLYDMHGNVYEWCQDWGHNNYYGAPTDGSAWESGGDQTRRMQRGGSWVDTSTTARSAYRRSASWDYVARFHGLRVVTGSIPF
jgi:formylglycine-generating enzyme required for sulfatase activity